MFNKKDKHLLKLYLLDTSCELLFVNHQGISKLNTVCV